MDEPATDPWTTWTLCSLQLQGLALAPTQTARVARTLARLAPLAQRLVDEQAGPDAAPPAPAASAA